MLSRLMDRVMGLFRLDLDLSIGRDPINAITDDLYLGSRPGPEQLPLLQQEGITHVVSCLVDADRSKVAFLEEGFTQLFIPLRDGMHEDIASTFPLFFDLVRDARAQHPRAKVFVHCEAGVSRSASLVIAQLMQQSRRRFFDVYGEVRAQRGEVLPNIGFASQLQRFELELHDGDAGPSPCSLARYLREVCMTPVDTDTLDEALTRNDHDALKAIQSIFGEEIPRVIQGARR